MHRDIKPSNLYVRASDRRVILIDFGAAREAVGRQGSNMTSLVTPGYSPPEQYTTRGDRYGPWTDLYALGAVLYRCVTGRSPTEAAERLLEDRLEPAVRAGAGRYSVNLLEVIDRALAVQPEHRFPSVQALQEGLEDDSDDTIILGPLLKAGRRLGQEPKKPSPANLFLTPPPKPFDADQLAILPPLETDHRVLEDHRQLPRWAARFMPVWPHSLRSNRMVIGGSLLGGTLAALAVGWLWFSQPASEEHASVKHAEEPTRTAESGVLPPSPIDGPAVSVLEPSRPASLASALPDSMSESGRPNPPVASLPAPSETASAPLAQDRPAPPVAPAPAPSNSPPLVDSEKGLPGTGVDGLPDRSLQTTVIEPPPAEPAIDQPAPAVLPRNVEAPTPEATAVVAPLTPVAKSVARPETANSAGGATVASKSVPGSKSQEDSAARLPAKASVNKTRVRSVSSAATRNARRLSSRKQALTQADRPESELPAREKSVHKPNVGNPWESPTSTGFNQK
ncbi:MAG: hypothetical protein IPL51_14165 [Candidatus Competibacteraceae bacterium]|nr:hypothetical protein [Candidatus Competibacteraceae bacterium]